MSQPDPIIGATIGKYQLNEFLGEGALAKVYKAYHPDLRRQCLNEDPAPRVAQGPGFIVQF